MLFFAPLPRLLLLIVFCYGLAVLVFTPLWHWWVIRRANQHGDQQGSATTDAGWGLKVAGTHPLQVTNFVVNWTLLGVTVSQLFLITLPLFVLIPLLPVALVTNALMLWAPSYIRAEATGLQQRTAVLWQRVLFWVTYGLGMLSILVFLPITQSMSQHTGPM